MSRIESDSDSPCESDEHLKDSIDCNRSGSSSSSDEETETKCSEVKTPSKKNIKAYYKRNKFHCPKPNCDSYVINLPRHLVNKHEMCPSKAKYVVTNSNMRNRVRFVAKTKVKKR